MLFSSPSTVPAGSLANASSSGAKTVKGPFPFSVSINPAAWTAAMSVLKFPTPIATSTMSISLHCLGFMNGGY